MKKRKNRKKLIAALMMGSLIAGTMPGYGAAEKVYAEEIKEGIKMEISSSGYDALSGEGDMVDSPVDMEFLPEQNGDMDMVQGASLDLSTVSFQVSDIRDSSKVSTFNGADGKQAVIVFGWVTTCDYTTGALRNLTKVVSKVDMSQLNIYVFLIERPNREDILSRLDNVSDQIIVNTLWNYEENKENEEYSNLFSKCFQTINNGEGLSMPLIIYKGIDGAVYEYTTGYATGQTDLGTIEESISKGGLKVSAKVEAPTFSEVPYVGGKDISFTSATKDAIIYYSTTGSDITTEDKWVTNGGKAALGGFNGIVYARAYYDGRWSELTSHDVTTPQVATPTISVSGYKATIKASTSGSTIYYTTDGSSPTVEKGIKGNGTTVTLDCFAGTLKAIAVKSGYSNSGMARKVLVNSSKSRNVSFAVKGVFGGRNVTFDSGLEGAKIYYSSTTSKLTTNDKYVDAGGTVLFENFYGTIYARTYYNGEWGNVCRLILKIPIVNTPSISVDSKGYATIKTTTPGSRICYTTDGTTPSMNNGKMVSSPYARVYVGKSGRIRAIAVRSCFTNSYECTYTW